MEGGRIYTEFKISMVAQIRGKSSLFVGLADRQKYRPEQLVSTFWKDSPSSFYWNVWNNKLVKIDENGNQTGIATGYGCCCEESEEISIGLSYDPKNLTLEYYKNGVSQGIAFHDVPRGFYPAIDLWFEAGHAEILKFDKPTMREYL